ncbi:F-box protein At5g03100-like [Aegilops tauschii subsp. strangulata]|uniref:F-box protein At5g03100-like n=1 Tax=Aegilops tauschii subsp. strangulata TaxID=200361 RepID=UPI00098AB3ED|nr:putative F-box protein At1g32020 [Aegilops tauschii subsp. strangulata]
MEIESNPKYCRIIKESSSEEDRLSGLPDDVLHSIVGRVPLKQAVRTSALSMSWACLWLHALAASAVLDFTDCDFVHGQSPRQIVATVNRCLEVHGVAPIDVFRVVLSPFDAFGLDVVRWAATALGRGAREVGVDLTQHADGRGALELPGDILLKFGMGSRPI